MLISTDLLQYQYLVSLLGIVKLMCHQQNQSVAKETLDAAGRGEGREAWE